MFDHGLTVIVTDEFTEWYEGLTEAQGEAVIRVVSELEQAGTALGSPLSSAIQGSKIAMRELRTQQRGRKLRILYVFDKRRDAVLLIGGDKTAEGNRWYKRMVPLAEAIYAEYRKEQGE